MTSLWSAASLSSLNNALDNIANGATVGSVSHGNVSNESPVVVAPKVGDVLSGNAVASGNETSTGNGNSASSSASDLVDTTGIIDGVTRSVDLGSIVGR